MNRLSKWIFGVAAALGCQVALAQEPGKLPVTPATPAPVAGCAAPNPCCAPQVSCIANACCDNGCGHHGEIIGGLGLYVVQPYFEFNPGFSLQVQTGIVIDSIPPTNTTEVLSDVRHHVEAAPELWLGYIGENGLGGRLRWWYFRQGTSDFISVPTNATTTTTLFGNQINGLEANAADSFVYGYTSKLQLEVFDAEVLKDLQAGDFDLLFSGGLRLAHVNQRFDEYAISTNPADGIGTGLSGSSFHGVGPTVALETRYGLGNGGLAVYGKARASVLFGSYKVTELETEISTAPFNDTFIYTNNKVVGVGELEIGAEAGRRMGDNRVFGQVGLVGQDWIGVGNSTFATNGNLGFFGFAFRLGVNY